MHILKNLSDRIGWEDKMRSSEVSRHFLKGPDSKYFSLGVPREVSVAYSISYLLKMYNNKIK